MNMLTRGRRYETNPSVADRRVNLIGVQYERDPGAERETINSDHFLNTAAICNSSMSHTAGNVVSTVEKYILDIFPQDTFKTITVATTLASRQLVSLPRQLIKKEQPTMVLVPRISFGQDDNRFLAHTLMNSRFTNTFANWGEGSLIPLAFDNKKQIAIHGHYNRAVMYIDVVLSFETFIEQTNWMGFIHNMIPIGHNFFIRAPLELYLPVEFCELLANLADIKIESEEDDSVQNYLTYMNSIWYHPITYKLKGASNSHEFFMYYLTDIDTVVQEPQLSPGTKDGQIRRNFDISFTIRCDFNTIGYFALNTPAIPNSFRVMSKDPQAIVPIFTDVFDINNFQLPVGWSVLGFPIFKLGIGETSVSLKPIMNRSIETVLHHHLKNGIPIERFINIEFRENGHILKNEAYHIDWIKKELVVSKPDYHRTYRLLITVSHDYVNNFIKDVYKLE